MNKHFWQIAILALILALVLCACGTAEENKSVEAEIPTESVAETIEPEIEPDPEWLSDTAIDEACACLFPLEGEKNVELAQEILRPLVESGNAEAQYYWGYIFHSELSLSSEDEKESLYWFELAAEQSFSKAYLAAAVNSYIDSSKKTELIDAAKQAGLFELSSAELGPDGCTLMGIYYEDLGNYTAAMKWYLDAASLGSSKGINQVGWFYTNGLGVEKNSLVALEWYLKGTNLGDIRCMNNYGWLLSNDEIVYELINQEYTSLFEAYRKAAEEGDPVAMYNLGYLYDIGMGGVRRNESAAAEWYHKAADAGDAYAMYTIGSDYMSGYGRVTDYALAMEWLQKAADLGNVNAMSQIISMYEQGLGVKQDKEMAKEWSKKAANHPEYYEQLHSAGYINYVQDKSDLQSIGMEWLQKAANAGDSYALNNIGFYGSPSGRERWYRQSAELGNTTAMLNLGSYYKNNGEYDEAMKWFIVAYTNGEDNAAKKINELLSNKQGVNAYFENYGELISAKP